MAHILIVDDEESLAAGIAEFLELQGHTAAVANSLKQAREAVAAQPPTVVLLDLMLPDGSGLELFDAFENHTPEKIIIITGHTGVKSIIGSMVGDGVIYMKKPIELRDLTGILNTLNDDPPEVEAVSPGSEHFGLLLGESPVMQKLYKVIRQVAVTDSTVFIQGESGTGKELVSEAIHKLSQRQGKFVPVNCGGLTIDLVSSQLFGHEKGSFTGADQHHAGFFERAKDGTLFLDEITEMPMEIQTHLLRVLETGKVQKVGSEKELPVNARLLSATNRDPSEAVREGALRKDLYYRLQVFPLVLPPLRERTGDVTLLATSFLHDLNTKNKSKKQLSTKALQILEQHSWPGNVRELKHTIHRAYIMSESDLIEVPDRFDEDLPGEIEGMSVGRSIADVEKDLIVSTLEHFGGDKSAAAATLGVSLKTLYNRLKAYEDEGLSF